MRKTAPWNWPALILSPSLALANLSITYALVTPSCAHQRVGAMHGVAIASLLISLWFTFTAYRNWDRGPRAAVPEDSAAARGPFLASVAVMVGALSSLVIVAQWIPQWILSPCAV